VHRTDHRIRGFAHYQDNPRCNRWANGVTDEAFVYEWEAAMRVTINRKPWRTEFVWDDLDSLNQIATLRRLNAERKKNAGNA
jgi:hypothetical protein